MDFLPPGLGQGIMDQITSAVAGWEAFGALGVISLLFISMGLFEAIDWGINGAMGTRKKVGFLTGRLLVLAYITGAMIFFTVAAVADHVFQLILAAPGLAEFTEGGVAEDRIHTSRFASTPVHSSWTGKVKEYKIASTVRVHVQSEQEVQLKSVRGTGVRY